MVACIIEAPCQNTVSNSNGNVEAAVKPASFQNSQSNGLNGRPSEAISPSEASNGILHHEAEPIAIIGMGMRLPGGVHDAESFWDLLVHKRHGRCRVPSDRYNIDAWYGAGKTGHVGTQYGYFLEDLNLANMDATFWSMSRQEAERMDPQQRLLLEVVYECLENAGAQNWRGQNIGCYVGTFGEDWLDMDGKDSQSSHMYRLTGYGDYITANRVSYEFDLKGPSMTIRTACSSSLTGLHEACQALQHGICSAAIVGGTNIIITPRMTIAMTERGVLSPSGYCKTFDANADGYARGEAVSALYIKKLRDAVRDGDPIRAVIRSTCVNNDGKTFGLTTPNAEAHESLIRKGHQLAGITDFSKTAMVECHGTGTKIGDPIEAKAVANVFGHCGIYIGSVKPNIGHSEGASGLSSVIKMVLALEQRTIPPNINFHTPNPEIAWKEANLKVPTHPMPWPTDRAERVVVNSFGIGGANAHVLLESAASFGLDPADSPMDFSNDDRPKLLVFSATHPDSLRRSVENHASYLSSHPESLNDLSYTLSSKRQAHALKGFCIAYEDQPLELSRITKAEGTPNIIFAFTGQGAQFARMGYELLLHESSFAATIGGLDKILASLPEPPSWTIQDEILKTKSKSRLLEAQFSQPCCTAIQIALVDILTKWGVKPAGVVGHSSGEIGAAYAAGVLTAPEAILVAYYRGLATIGLGQMHRGGMAAIGLGREAVTPYLRTGVIIGCENSPDSTTLTGDLETLGQIMEEIRKSNPDILVRALHVECAYHSHHMRTAAVKYSSLLEKSICAKSPTVPFFSSVSGRLSRSEEILSTSYWVQNLISPVLFYPAVTAAIKSLESPQSFLEIGPHSALAGPIRQIIRDSGKDAYYIPTLIRNADALDCLLKTAGELWISNAHLNWNAINPTGQLLTDLPTYPWTYEEDFWHESRLSKEWRQKTFPHHELLGDRLTESSELDPTWRNILRLDHVPWIQDHEVAHDVLFPAAGYISIAGEAIRQLSSREDYTVRGVSFLSALMVPEDRQIEIQTHLHKLRLTDSLDSSWYEFTIASLNNGVWNKHCAGQVRDASEGGYARQEEIVSLPRKVSSRAWYRVMAKVGLAYGPRFRGLHDISAAVSECKAVATLSDSPKEGEALYPLHPAIIDSAFQLLGCAAVKGVGRSFDRLSVPTYIQELYIKPTKETIAIEAEAIPGSAGGITGNLVGISAGETVIGLKGLRLSPLGDNDEGTNDDTHAAVELEWKSDVNLLDATRLMRPAKDITNVHILIEKLALSCMIESRLQLLHVDTAHSHLLKFLGWLGTRQALAVQGQYPVVDDCAAIAAMDSPHRVKLIEDLLAELVQTEASAPAIAIHRIFKQSKSIFEGSTEALDVLMEDNILTKVYDFMQIWDDAQFFELLGHHKPNIKILEIGAGVGSKTSTILPHLKSAYGERMFGSYTYTDISAGFFVQAQERFKGYQGINYAILDISQDPIQQGYEPESFDLVVAANVLHATPSLEQTLKNVRKLLQPHGRLFLQEVNPTTRWINYVMGVLPGWWLGDEDGRSVEPYVSPERWDKELKRAGFGGVDSVAYDGHLLNNIIARPARKEKSKRLTILCKERSGLPMDTIVQSFTDNAYEIDFCSLDQTPKAGQDILSVLDINTPFLFSASGQDFAAFKGFIARIQDARILWVTGASQINCRDPNYSLILGVARTIRNETGKDFATLELDSFEDLKAWATTVHVFHEFRHRFQDSDNDPDFEYVYSDGRVQVGRFHWTNVSEQLKAVKDPSHPQKLDIGRPGILQTLNWKQEEFTELAGNEVQIETRAVGLNFKDVLIAMGVVELNGRGLGCERSGIITKVGPDVKYLKNGDRVLCCSDGSFSTSLSVSELCCAKIPESLSFVEAATIPLVYSTVIHGLMDIAHLSKDQTVLIHSAAGGIGICALQIAKMIGAEIFCTVGNQKKVDFIMQTFDIPRNRIFNSRDLSFVSDVLRETNDKGVDVVLNSLSGELLHGSWKCVAEFGSMIEIGKRDLVGHGNLAMDVFEQNRSYVGVDMSFIVIKRPHIIHDLLRRAVLFYEQGHIKPIAPIQEFDGVHVEEAMRYMQQGQHIGKVVVRMPDDASELQATSNTMNLVFRPDASYLFVGGLGGLGRSIASWMVEKGAKHIVFFSRSAGKVTAEDPYIKELVAQGCSVQTFSGSVSNAADVRNIVSSVEKPIAGVLQASMVLNDASLDDMTFEQWQAASVPKIQGTWNLHQTFLERKQPLDFFLLFSSLSGIVGQIGQANYAAANTFLDAFVQYRHSLGLPASVLDIGVVEDIGYLSQNEHVLEAIKATSVYTLHEQELLSSLQLMINRSAPAEHLREAATLTSSTLTRPFVNQSQVGLGVRSTLPFSAPNNRSIWKKDPRMAVYRNLESSVSATGSVSGSEGLTRFLLDCQKDPARLDLPESIEFLAQETGTTLGGFMMRGTDGLDMNTPMSSLGVDSLVSIELKNWFKKKVGVDFTVLEVANAASLRTLGGQAAGQLKEKLQARG